MHLNHQEPLHTRPSDLRSTMPRFIKNGRTYLLLAADIIFGMIGSCQTWVNVNSQCFSLSCIFHFQIPVQWTCSSYESTLLSTSFLDPVLISMMIWFLCWPDISCPLSLNQETLQISKTTLYELAVVCPASPLFKFYPVRCTLSIQRQDVHRLPQHNLVCHWSNPCAALGSLVYRLILVNHCLKDILQTFMSYISFQVTMASPSFCRQEDGKLCPVQDYRR